MARGVVGAATLQLVEQTVAPGIADHR